MSFLTEAEQCAKRKEEMTFVFNLIKIHPWTEGVLETQATGSWRAASQDCTVSYTLPCVVSRWMNE